MGVKGLWRLLNSCGTPVPLESLENKILAVDISIWLHQAVKGFKGFSTGSGANAHLLTLFHRICKLLYYRIRPVFVFDGGIPQLKRQTLSFRKLRREVAANKAKEVRKRLLSNILRSQAVKEALGKRNSALNVHHISKPEIKEDMFELPPLIEPLNPNTGTKVSTALGDEENPIVNDLKDKNLHNFEFESDKFKSLPLEVQHEILSELHVTRKENSWSNINEMPQESNIFSSFQMDRLLKRNNFQKKLGNIRIDIQEQQVAEIEAQMFGDLEKHVSLTHRIISEDATHSILIKKLKDNHTDAGSTDTLKEAIIEQRKQSAKTFVTKQDFLVELEKQGIVTTSSTNKQKRDFDSSFSESEDESSLSEDEIHIPSNKRRKFEEANFLKAVENVLDDDQLTQQEILSLIQQSQLEVENESLVEDKICKAKGNMNFEDLSMPSTLSNAPGQIYKSDTESSTDDDDFIDVTDVESPDSLKADSNLSEDKISSCVQSSTEKGVSDVGTNIDTILGAKTDSLYIKIIQKSLDDMIHKSNNKLNVKSPLKNALLETSPTKQKIKIDLNFAQNRNPNWSKEEDIFKDVFNCEKNSDESHTHNILTTTKKINFVKKLDTSEIANVDSDGTNLDLKNIDMTDELKSKVMELIKDEVNNLINNITSDSKSQDEVVKAIKSTTTNFSKTNVENDKGIFNKKVDCDHKNTNPMQHIEINLDKERRKEMSFQDADIETSESVRKEDISELQVESTIETPSNSENSQIFKKVSSQTGKLECSDTSAAANHSLEKHSSLHSVTTTKEVSDSVEVQPETPLKYSTNELKHMETELDKEQNSLIAEAHNNDRMAMDMSDQIYREAQELLQMFGLPYLIAPMEAEAQCAFLDEIGLTHGTITDDSDVFLFGGKKVYRNFFDHAKNVELYTIENIKYNMGLNRNKMIALAVLTGSDYTVGIESVGGVLGMEILSEFPGSGIECLNNLKKWWKAASKNATGIPSKIKQRVSSLHFPESFPSENIFKAYLEPEVDDSKDKFTWNIPSAEKLQIFATTRFSWSQSKTNEIIVPIFKKLGIKNTQMRLDSYFTNIKLVKAPQHKSKRLADAIARNKGENSASFRGESKSLLKERVTSSVKSRKSKTSLKGASKDKGSGSTKRALKGKERHPVKNDKQNKELISTQIDDESEDNEDIPMTKEDQKIANFKKLLEKQKITQSEKEKLDQLKKKEIAFLVLAKKKKTN